MSSTLGVDGLVSGLDTTSLINSLMKAEAIPQTLLKERQTNVQSLVTALQGINTRLRSVSDTATKAADAANWNSFTATSTSNAATASTTTAAKVGSITFSVDAVAKSQVSLSAAVTDGTLLAPDNPPTLTLKKADGTFVTVTAASNSLDDMVSAINDSDMGVKATAVQVSSGSAASYRLQFTGTTTGTAGAFELYVGDQAAVEGGTAPRLDSAVATPANDAKITLWKGSTYEQAFTQSSNTFTGLMTGVDVTVSKATDVGETATVSVAPDASKVSDLAANMVSALTVVFQEIDSRSTTVTTANSDGTTSVTGGLFTGDTSMTTLRSQLMEAATYPINGISPSKMGISIQQDGTVTFDKTKFAAALKNDPEGTAEYLQTLAARVQTTANQVSDPTSGSVTQRITSQQSLVKNYGDQIGSWDTRLELRRSTLQATYSALEVSLSNLNAQSSWLTSQLASLSTTTA
jgi:flagellar hook-associated protein 2